MQLYKPDWNNLAEALKTHIYPDRLSTQWSFQNCPSLVKLQWRIYDWITCLSVGWMLARVKGEASVSKGTIVRKN